MASSCISHRGHDIDINVFEDHPNGWLATYAITKDGKSPFRYSHGEIGPSERSTDVEAEAIEHAKFLLDTELDAPPHR